jgi:hypothetical protein
MANPTTNYGFVLPTATDLVTDLPADFDVALQGVDTRLKALQPGTTLGDLTFASATANTNTRLPIGTTGQTLTVVAGVPAWQTGTTGDIEGVTAGVGISGGGTSGTVTVTNSMATAYTTKGDLVPATASQTFARLGVGANDTVLTADSTAATGMKWATPSAGGMTLLSTTTITATATISITGISQSYKHLFVTILDFRPATTATDLQCEMKNASAGAINAQCVDIAYNGTNPLTSANLTGNVFTVAKDVNNSTGAGTNVNGTSFYIYNYSATSQKQISGSYGVYGVTNGNYRPAIFGGSSYGATSAVACPQLNFLFSLGSFAATGTIKIYGVN